MSKDSSERMCLGCSFYFHSCFLLNDVCKYVQIRLALSMQDHCTVPMSLEFWPVTNVWICFLWLLFAHTCVTPVYCIGAN